MICTKLILHIPGSANAALVWEMVSDMWTCSISTTTAGLSLAERLGWMAYARVYNSFDSVWRSGMMSVYSSQGLAYIGTEHAIIYTT